MTMQQLILQAIPNQRFQFVADGQQYDIRIWSDGDDMTFMDVTMNGQVTGTSFPCLVGQQVMQFSYLEGAGGNFFWSTASGNNPQWENFATDDTLWYASNAELAAQRAANAAAAVTLTLASNQAG